MPTMFEKRQQARAIAFVVPCFNEYTRLPIREFKHFIQKHEHVSLIFVDDRSTDGTSGLIVAEFKDQLNVELIQLPRNLGKGEAVRVGLLSAISSGAEIVGYCDADLSVNLDEMMRLSGLLVQSDFTVLLGSRVRLVGRTIVRKKGRHILGRVLTILSFFVTGLSAYDSQCGAKIFRVNDVLVASLDEQFISRWCFDIELLLRMRRCDLGSTSIREEPLESWIESGDSRLGTVSRFIAVLDLFRLRRRYGKFR